MNIEIEKNSELVNTLFSRREAEHTHLSYTTELAFYSAVQNGEIERLNEMMVPLSDSHHGTLSVNPLRSLQYHLIIGIAMITRFCVDGGLDHETAYTLSDLYIQSADKCTKNEDINVLHQQMVFDFANRMKDLHQHKVTSHIILLCLDYIHNNLHKKIVADELSMLINLNKTYLSTLFKKEVGLGMHAYIEGQKIEAAKNLLQYSEYSSVDIANYLSFSSHSHFITIFKKNTGLTPRTYKDRYFRTHWNA